MTVTPDAVYAAFQFLVQLEPFRKWKLPSADEMEFRINFKQGEDGHYNRYCGTDHHWIAISAAIVSHTFTLIEIVAHEMIHLKQAICKTETPNTQHNAEFRKIAKQVCSVHGWDSKRFL